MLLLKTNAFCGLTTRQNTLVDLLCSFEKLVICWEFMNELPPKYNWLRRIGTICKAAKLQFTKRAQKPLFVVKSWAIFVFEKGCVGVIITQTTDLIRGKEKGPSD